MTKPTNNNSNTGDTVKAKSSKDSQTLKKLRTNSANSPRNRKTPLQEMFGKIVARRDYRSI